MMDPQGLGVTLGGLASGRCQRWSYLCPCDINPVNFKKLPDGKVVALNFVSRASCPLLFAVAMAMALDDFTRKVARPSKYPISGDVEAMTSASYSLVPYGKNDIGQPGSFSFT